MLQESAGEAFLQEALRRQVRYVQEALTVANILPHSDGSLKTLLSTIKIFLNRFLHWSIVVSNNTIFLTETRNKFPVPFADAIEPFGQLVPEAFPEDFFSKTPLQMNFKTSSTPTQISHSVSIFRNRSNTISRLSKPFFTRNWYTIRSSKTTRKQGILSRIFVPIFSPARYGNLLFENLETPIRIILLGIGGTVIALLIDFHFLPFLEKQPSRPFSRK